MATKACDTLHLIAVLLLFIINISVIEQEDGVPAEGSKYVKLCGDQPDEICNLPGLNGSPHVRMRSGYITVNEISDRRLWYLVADREDHGRDSSTTSMTAGTTTEVAAEGEVAAAAAPAPVVLWLTGGPGCSSLDAFIYEHGPFKFSYGTSSSSSSSSSSWSFSSSSSSRPKGEEGNGGGGNVEGGKEQEHVEGGAGEQRQEEEEKKKKKERRPVVLEPNPYSWTKVATIIYVDSPAGAGMSYSGRPDVDYHTNDEYTIADLVVFLQGLTDRYPELATAPFFLAGESYGGVFVPLLARELVRVNRERRREDRSPLVDLQGYSVGNPVTDDVVDGNAQLFFAADMGYLDPPSWRRMRAACGDMFWNATRGTECWDAQGVVKDDLWDLNWYDVLDSCAKSPDDGGDDEEALAKLGNDGDTAADTAIRSSSSGSSSGSSSSGSSSTSGGGGDPRFGRSASSLERRFYWPFTVRMRTTPSESRIQIQNGVEDQEQQDRAEQQLLEPGRRGGVRLWGPWLRHVVPCMDRSIALDWLNRDEVRSALHAAPWSVIGGWQPCSDVLYYRLDTMDLVSVHEELVREGLRALVYSGDHDMVVPHTGTRTWLYDKANLGRTDGPLRPWMLHGQIAGFTARFGAGSGLRFATVKGAGHMVPQSKPLQALHLLKAFLYDKEL
ncbi:hypothetical protein VOLCADRAFT_118648 [Volvox carteri f. nagariensis]|uniref:Carboxypeptidase n=1 Tax=Volvox carteri f. nagariensis TaxID=3068 RepID=D8U6D8_VOLCA|nr:uncharacterized protein VOLCADRAFT_118648 [Volvox carteri f. nagariensis]EFJ44699.1 hypothetical protein VOLCADRAFT_118648 [Volvox carteri f. nagariensis]|eukprot:XP_002954275.1 hypothetical protein VOLCADRAFT_118648 [Volvox carteri f. nagariensis]